jgi:sulfatase modifying factor 1
MQMHKKIVSFNDIYALGDIKPQDRLAVFKKLKEYRQILGGISEENKKTAQYKELMQKITEITKELGVGQVTAGFVRINPGEFVMGAKDIDDNHPHKVTITRSFEMAQYKVTQKEFLKFKKDHVFGLPGHAKNPAEKVSWNDAAEYCKWLSLQADDIDQSHKDAVRTLSPEDYMAYAFRHPEARLYRLPTEAEWEYACREEGMVIDGYFKKQLYQFAVQNTSKQNNESTQPVGSKKPNALGLHHMLTSVWEWCLDVYDEDTSKNAENDPCNLKKGQDRVLRGGSWADSKSEYLRSSSRCYHGQGDRRSFYGFRLVRSLP